jgi:hypothetical protein
MAAKIDAAALSWMKSPVNLLANNRYRRGNSNPPQIAFTLYTSIRLWCRRAG